MKHTEKKQELCLAYVERSGSGPSLSHYTRASARGYLTLRRRALPAVQAPVWTPVHIDESCSTASAGV